jgi:hypothetical protein
MLARRAPIRALPARGRAISRTGSLWLESLAAAFAGQVRVEQSSLLSGDAFAGSDFALTGAGDQLGCASVDGGDDGSSAVQTREGLLHVPPIFQ